MEATATPDTSEATEHENAPIAEQPEVKVAPETGKSSYYRGSVFLEDIFLACNHLSLFLRPSSENPSGLQA